MNTYKLEVVLTDTEVPFFSLQELEKEIVRVLRNELLLRIDSMSLRTHQLLIGRLPSVKFTHFTQDHRRELTSLESVVYKDLALFFALDIGRAERVN